MRRRWGTSGVPIGGGVVWTAEIGRAKMERDRERAVEANLGRLTDCKRYTSYVLDWYFEGLSVGFNSIRGQSVAGDTSRGFSVISPITNSRSHVCNKWLVKRG